MGRRTRGGPMAALSPLIVIRAVGVFVSALKAAAAETKAAKDPASDGGRAITAEEALGIVEVVLGSIIEDLVEILTGA